MGDGNAPWHAHIYCQPEQHSDAENLRRAFHCGPAILFVGALTAGPAGPHPIPQFEVHFRKAALTAIRAMISASGLTALVHPLTHDDLADHTTLGYWFGEPLVLDLATLDPPGHNQSMARFGLRDF